MIKVEKKLYRSRELKQLLGLPLSTIYDWMKRGEFPKPIKIGKRAVAWKKEDIDRWLKEKYQQKADVV